MSLMAQKFGTFFNSNLNELPPSPTSKDDFLNPQDVFSRYECVLHPHLFDAIVLNFLFL